MKISECKTYQVVSGARVYVVRRQMVRKIWVYLGYEVDRAGRQTSDFLMWKSDGKDWAGIMSNNITREADTGMKLDEAGSVVLERLIEACETDRAMPGKVGPKAYGNAMPTTVFTDVDVWVLELEEMIHGGGKQTRERNTAISGSVGRRAMCTPDRISRMEEALGWMRLVIDAEARQILIAYAACKARGDDWGQYVEQRNRKNKTQNAWGKRTVYRKIAKTLQDIGIKLRNRAIILRDCGGLPLAQERGEQPHNPIAFTVCGQRDDDLIQALDEQAA